MYEFLKNYKIYEDGRVQRIVDSDCSKAGRFLKPEITKLGYHRITLCHKGKTKRFQLHRLVALVYLPNPDNFPIVNHKDGNPHNNHVSNLEWCTYSHNLQHAYDVLNRDKLYGEKRTWAKLSDDKIRLLRKLPIGALKKLALEWGCSYKHLRAVYNGRNWNHVN